MEKRKNQLFVFKILLGENSHKYVKQQQFFRFLLKNKIFFPGKDKDEYTVYKQTGIYKFHMSSLFSANKLLHLAPIMPNEGNVRYCLTSMKSTLLV